MKGFVKFLLGVFSAVLGLFLLKAFLEKKQEDEESPINVYKSLTELNKRQNKILEQITKSNVLLPSEIYSIFPDVSTRTLRRDMNVLISKNFVRQEGSTKDTRYLLNK